MDNLEAVLSALGLKATKGGAVVSVFGWLASSAAAAWFGALIALAGLCLQFYFNRKRDKREQQAHEARMKEIGREAR
jgi:putative copper export protein